MIEPETEIMSEPERSSPALKEAARELQAAEHDAQVAFHCIALGDIDRAHTHALTSRVAVDAAVTALAAALSQADRALDRDPPAAHPVTGHRSPRSSSSS